MAVTLMTPCSLFWTRRTTLGPSARHGGSLGARFANRPYSQMFSGGENDKEEVEAVGARVAALYKELSYPSATRFKAALAKRGIQVPDAFVRQLVSGQ